MKQSIVHISIVVKDYDEAIDFYTKKLHFDLVEDIYQPEQDKRWVVIAPPNSTGTTILLARASKPEQEPFIGNQTGGRVFLFLNSDNFWRDYDEMVTKGIEFVRKPKKADYGTVAVFKDLYGNLWDLLELNEVKETLYYSIAVLRIKEIEKTALAISELKKLQQLTILERGNISFDIQQEIENPTRIMIWECFANEQGFKEHLISKHFLYFMKLGLVELEKGYLTNKI